MPKIDPSEYYRQNPVLPLAPIIDVLFVTLIFFITISIFSQMETQLNISVPKSKHTTESIRSPGEIIINISKEGQFFVNEQILSLEGLEGMLNKVAKMFPDQPVIIRADERTFHKHIINVLDACTRANIWDVSFSTTVYPQ